MNHWEHEFRQRMKHFREGRESGIELSIKIRVTSGCFHREHSPEAYRIIDNYMRSHPSDTFCLEEHESGPEVLVYFALATAGITLAKSVVDLIATIIKARADGIRKGDSPCHPLVVIVRGVDVNDRFHEEEVMQIDSHAPPSIKAIEDSLSEAINRIAAERVRQRKPS